MYVYNIITLYTCTIVTNFPLLISRSSNWNSPLLSRIKKKLFFESQKIFFLFFFFVFHMIMSKEDWGMNEWFCWYDCLNIRSFVCAMRELLGADTLVSLRLVHENGTIDRALHRIAMGSRYEARGSHNHSGGPISSRPQVGIPWPNVVTVSGRVIGQLDRGIWSRGHGSGKALTFCR